MGKCYKEHGEIFVFRFLKIQFFDIDCAYSGKKLPILCNFLHIVVKMYTISRYSVHDRVI